MRTESRLSLLYFALGAIWILVSDSLLFGILELPPESALTVATYKGWLYVAVTSVLLYLLLRREFRARARTESERKVAEEQLAYQANLLQHVNDAVISVDLNYCVTSWNQAATEIYGYTSDEVIGRPLRDLIGTQYPDVGRERAMTAVHEEGQWRGETIQKRKDGTEIRALTSSRLLRDMRGKPMGIVTINRDITEQKRLEEEAREKERLQAELAQAMQNRALHNRFMSMVSHEFRTPLTTIQLAAEMLERYFDRMSPESRQERLEQIEAEIERLLTMLDDILLVLKTEATRLHFKPEPVDLVGFTKQVVDDMKLTTGETHPLVFSSEEPELKAEVDQGLLRQALINLLANAVKYAPKGTPVHIDLKRNGLRAIIEVRDQGIGISDKDVKFLFDAFYRGENVGNIPGTGLGLLIASQAVDLHGGSIDVKSTLGEGSTFSLSLPLHQN